MESDRSITTIEGRDAGQASVRNIGAPPELATCSASKDEAMTAHFRNGLADDADLR